MSAINFHTKEISVKIVYYGPGLCGKTTSLQTIYASLPEDKRPQLVSLATEVDRTIFFDFLPVTAYRIKDFKVRLQLYTVPGQVFYNATRKLVLNGVDGVVFVADSQRAMRDSNIESLHNLADNLSELGLDVERVPTVIQFNKRDLPDIYSIEEMEELYNPRKLPAFPTIATSGEGLFEALKSLSQLVVGDLIKKGLGRQLNQEENAAPAGRLSTHTLPPPPAGSFATAVEEAVRGAAQVATSALGLWPAGETARLGERIEGALKTARWAEVILGVEQLVAQLARRWASTTGVVAEDPIPAFLLTKGVSPVRYRALWEAGRALRANQAVGRSEAMNAFVLALDALW